MKALRREVNTRAFARNECSRAFAQTVKVPRSLNHRSSTRGHSIETSKFCSYFSGSCISPNLQPSICLVVQAIIRPSCFLLYSFWLLHGFCGVAEKALVLNIAMTSGGQGPVPHPIILASYRFENCNARLMRYTWRIRGSRNRMF